MIALGLKVPVDEQILVPREGADLDCLLSEVAQGNRRALKILYDKMSPHLFAVLVRMVKRRDIAEDLLQDTFVHIWKKAHLFDTTRGTAKAWLVTLTRRKAIDLLRMKNQEPMGFDGELETLDGEVASQVTGVDNETRIALARAIDVLRPEVKQAMKLCYFYGLTHEELAEELNVPLGTAKSWIKRGLAQVKQCMIPT